MHRAVRIRHDSQLVARRCEASLLTSAEEQSGKLSQSLYYSLELALAPTCKDGSHVSDSRRCLMNNPLDQGPIARLSIPWQFGTAARLHRSSCFIVSQIMPFALIQ